MAFVVEYSAEAAEQLAKFKESSAKNPYGADAAIYQAIVRVIQQILTDERLCLAPQAFLKGEFAGVLRIKVRSACASSTSRQATQNERSCSSLVFVRKATSVMRTRSFVASCAAARSIIVLMHWVSPSQM